MLLFFDTETTGLPKDYKAPTTDLNNWPRVIQLAAILTSPTGEIKEELSFIIKPEGFTIPEASSKIHRITTERALSEGVDLTRAISNFLTSLSAATTIVGHNIGFDRKVLGAEIVRVKGKDILEPVPYYCTMLGSTRYCNIPGRFGPKWPKLSELYSRLFNEELEDAHDALVDIRATVRAYFKMKDLGLVAGTK